MDHFIDDVSMTGYLNKNWNTLVGASLLVLYDFIMPLHSKRPFPRDDMMALNKLIDEGTRSETLIVLGSFVNARSFAIDLPNYKHEACPAQLASMVTETWGSHNELQSLVERFNHVTMAILLSRHFLRLVRRIASRFKHCSKTHLAKEVLAESLL